MTAVYFTFVNHENKVQLFKRLDLIQDEDQKKRNRIIIEFLAESKNLFDMMAEEDPVFKQQEIFQNAGVLPVNRFST